MNRSDVCSDFLGTLQFDLYPFQEEALLAWFETEGGVLVSAPTGMGKTLIAEAAVFEALKTNRRMYYTSPLIALTDQKFREFQDKAERWGFPREQVGLITGNRKINPDALVRVVVAEILLNHLLESEPMDYVSGVVMDEFHYFNDFERGIVWELSLVLLPANIRLLLLSATVGNTVDFLRWARELHGRKLNLVQSQERRVPLEFIWVGDKLLTEHLPEMVSKDDTTNRAPALVFCFNRDECWEVAETLKGVSLIDAAARTEIERHLADSDLSQGAGPKLKQMLIRGVGVHHAGILPKYKEIVESLFLRKLVPFVICTETLSAGINLPARSVVLSTLVTGKPREKKLVPSSSAHQMFGRAGRPQFDKNGYVYALAHEDDARITKWKKKFDQIDPKSKDPGIMRVRKELERKKPSRRSTETYWTEGQFQSLIKAGPAKLSSRSMIPYNVLIYLLHKYGTLHAVREFISKRFTTSETIAKYQNQLEHMINNLAKFNFLTRAEDADHVTLSPGIEGLLIFRSIDPLYGAFLCTQLARGNFEEKVLALESILSLPPALDRILRPSETLAPGPLQTEVLQPMLISMGIATVHSEGGLAKAPDEDEGADYTGEEFEPRAMTLADMLKALFDAQLASPENVPVFPRWVFGAIHEAGGDFFKFIRSRDMVKNEGLILRHLLRLVILTGEFQQRSGGDPDYERISQLATQICQQVDPRYTDRFLAAEEEARKLKLP
ncbi:MAG: DEAD/DEAH box helicase [Planctomycetes bacterium]|nr:DEAD/DEAH box helicase [Planctomycetota bacterium]